MFAKNSARVLITGLRPQPPESALAGERAQCTDLLVLGQIIRLLSTQDGRPFLKRESLKRGVIHNICDTNIHFAEPTKSYDFFADDGSALTLTEEDGGQTAPAAHSNSTPGSMPEEHSQLATDQNLTGQDLLQLLPAKPFGDHWEDSVVDFDEEALKEGAYFVCRRRFKAALAGDDDLQRASLARTSAHSGEVISVPAGTLGRIDKRGGYRSEPLWIAEILPDSAPRPFWRSLFPLPADFGEPREPALPRKVILASSEIVEINHFFDLSGAEWTRLQELSNRTGEQEQKGAAPLTEIYSQPELPLAENIAIGQRSRIVEQMQRATIGLRLAFKNPEDAARRGTLVVDEDTSDRSRGEPAPHLFRRQCFLGLDRLENSQELVVSGVDVKVFLPTDRFQAWPGYYAIDLQFLLRPNFGLKQAPLVCRFPWGRIDLVLLDMAERILSSRFEIIRNK